MIRDPIRLPSDHQIVVLDEIDSTNSEALRRAADGEVGPLWVMARRQTSGRGRSGRAWSSSAGNLHASLLLTTQAAPEQAHQLALLAGIAVFDATLQLAECFAADGQSDGLRGKDPAKAPVKTVPGLALKWPNDGLISGEKYAGILSECRPSGASSGPITRATAATPATQVVVGIGINLGKAPPDVDRPVTSLGSHGINTDPETALAAVAQAFARWLPVWREGRGFGDIRHAWLERSLPLGERMGINSGGGLLWGRFAGLEPSGALLLQLDNGAIERFTFGDVSLPGA